MVTRALTPYGRDDLRCHFVSNVDGAHLSDTLKRLAPRRTLFLVRSEEHTSELQSLMRISYAVFCLKKKKPTSAYTTLSQIQKYSQAYNDDTHDSHKKAHPPEMPYIHINPQTDNT